MNNKMNRWVKYIFGLAGLVLLQACAVHEPESPTLLTELENAQHQHIGDESGPDNLDGDDFFIQPSINEIATQKEGIEPPALDSIGIIGADEKPATKALNHQRGQLGQSGQPRPLWDIRNRLQRFANQSDLDIEAQGQAEPRFRLPNIVSSDIAPNDQAQDDVVLSNQIIGEPLNPATPSWLGDISRFSEIEQQLQKIQAEENQKAFETQINQLKELQERALLRERELDLAKAENLENTTSPESDQPSLQQTQPQNQQTTQTTNRQRPGIDAQQDRTKRLALMVPLSGRFAALGENIRDNAIMALFDFQVEEVQLSIYDSHSPTSSIEEQTQKALNEGAQVILGPLLREKTWAVSNIANKQNVPVVSFSNRVNAARQGAEDKAGTYILGFLPDQQIDYLLNVLQSQKAEGESLKIGLLSANNDYGNLISTLLAKKVKALDGRLRIAHYARDLKDFSNPIRSLINWEQRQKNLTQKIAELEAIEDKKSKDIVELERLKALESETKNLPFDYLLIATNDQVELRTIAAQLDYYNAGPEHVQIIGLQPWQNFNQLWQEKALKGAWFVGVHDQAWQIYNRRFQSYFNRPTLHIGGLAYDGVVIAAYLLNSLKDQTLFEEQLTYHQGFNATNGTVRFLKNGLNERLYALYSVSEGQNILIDESAKHF
ncbi:MAG: penicillin-binding protein activator [Pseudomonadota bacterium]